MFADRKYAGVFKNPGNPTNQILKKKSFFRQSASARSMFSRHTIALYGVINARNKRRRRKIWKPRNVSLIFPGTYIFREFPFPRSVRSILLELGRMELFIRSRVSRIIYYQRRLTSAVNRGNTGPPKNQNSK